MKHYQKVKNLTPGQLLLVEPKEGVDGEQGIQGERGIQGIQGIAGHRGLDGDRGQQGKQGIPGVNGAPGIRVQGKQGSQGIQGQQGIATRGEKGEKGDRGERGPRGLTGPAPNHQIDNKRKRIRFRKPDGMFGEWLELRVLFDQFFAGGFIGATGVKQLLAGTNITLSPPNGKGVVTVNSTASGDVSSASNVNTAGVGVFKQKTGSDLEFKGVNAENATIVVTDDTADNEIDLKVGVIQTANIADDAVTNPKLADMSGNTVKMRNAGSSGDPGDVAKGTLTDLAAPASGDKLMGWNAAGALREIDVGNLPAGSVPSASETVEGIAELATQTETNTGTDDLRIITPLKLSGRAATTTRTGIAELATQTETNAGTDDARIVTPKKLNDRTSTETRTGITEIATQVETDAGTDDFRYLTPFKLRNTPLVTTGPVIQGGILTPPTLTSNEDDYSPTDIENNSIIRIDPGIANRDMSGIDSSAMASGQRLVLVNISMTFDIKLLNNNGSSLAANRFLLQTDETIKPNNSVEIWYDSVDTRWRALSLYLT